jgi:hypothetical protein
MNDASSALNAGSANARRIFVNARGDTLAFDL